MKKLLLSLCLTTLAAFPQYKLDSAGAPPSELAPPIREALQKDGIKVLGAGGAVVAELWFRTQAPSGAKAAEENVTLTTIPHGALLGALRFPGKGADRRGQPIQPGVYTLRLSFYPVDGDHQGVSPQRDFLLLTPAADDTDLNATPPYSVLVKWSAKAAGTSHPAILSLWKADSPQPKPSITQEGEDWVLHTTIGDTPIGLILVGAFAG